MNETSFETLSKTLAMSGQSPNDGLSNTNMDTLFYFCCGVVAIVVVVFIVFLIKKRQ